MKIRVAAEHLKPLSKQHSPLSQQTNKGPRHNNKNIRTRLTKTLERTGITNKDNVQAKITLTLADQTALAIVDPAALRQ